MFVLCSLSVLLVHLCSFGFFFDIFRCWILLRWILGCCTRHHAVRRAERWTEMSLYAYMITPMSPLTPLCPLCPLHTCWQFKIFTTSFSISVSADWKQCGWEKLSFLTNQCSWWVKTVMRRVRVVCPALLPPDLWNVVDGALHAAELRGLDVEHLQHVVGQRVDEVGDAGQRLGGVALGLLQCSLLVCWLQGDTFTILLFYMQKKKTVVEKSELKLIVWFFVFPPQYRHQKSYP